MPPQAHAFAPAQGVSSSSERPLGPHTQQVPVQAAASAAPAVGLPAGPAAQKLPAAGQHEAVHAQHLPVRAAASAAPAEGSSAGPAAHALPIAGQPVAGTASADPPQPAQALPVTVPAAVPQRESAASIVQSGELAERALHEHTAP